MPIVGFPLLLLLAITSTGQERQDAPDSPVKRAVEAMRKLADEVRSCQEDGFISQTKDKKPMFHRMHWGPPTDVRFDVRKSDSPVAPFEGILEFSISAGTSVMVKSAEEARTAPDWTALTVTTRHRHVFRIDGSHVEMNYRNFFSSQEKDWVLEQGKPKECWEKGGNP